jgi:hypothetical protein
MDSLESFLIFTRVCKYCHPYDINPAFTSKNINPAFTSKNINAAIFFNDFLKMSLAGSAILKI